MAIVSSDYTTPASEFGGPNFKYGDKELEHTDPLAHSANYSFITGVNGDAVSYRSLGFQDARQANYAELQDFIRARFTTRDMFRTLRPLGYVNYWPASHNAEWDVSDDRGLRLQASAIAEEGGDYSEILSYALAHEIAHLLIPSNDAHAGGNSPSALMSQSGSPLNTISAIEVTGDDAILVDVKNRRSVQ